MGRAPSVLLMVSVTSARPSGGREVVPAKTTSSILPPRSDLTPCSPMTQDRASTTLDLPEPLGPTTQVMPGSRRSVVAEANDLKPRSVRDFRYTRPLLPQNCHAMRPSRTSSPPEDYRSGRMIAGNGTGAVNPAGVTARRQKPPLYRACNPAHFPGGRWPRHSNTQ